MYGRDKGQVEVMARTELHNAMFPFVASRDVWRFGDCGEGPPGSSLGKSAYLPAAEGSSSAALSA